jgi:SAM-dependent methyltransferase
MANVSAMELDEFASEYAAHTTDVDVRRGWLPDNIPYNEKFDLICMFDVLEHIQDDKKALTKIAGLLKPAGTLIITVPAYSWLYGAHDKMLQHFRRYSKNTLNETINYSDLKVLKSSYFNTLLFPLVILARLTDMLKNSDESIGYSTPNNIVKERGRNNFPNSSKKLALFASLFLETECLFKIRELFSSKYQKMRKIVILRQTSPVLLRIELNV